MSTNGNLKPFRKMGEVTAFPWCEHRHSASLKPAAVIGYDVARSRVPLAVIALHSQTPFCTSNAFCPCARALSCTEHIREPCCANRGAETSTHRPARPRRRSTDTPASTSFKTVE